MVPMPPDGEPPAAIARVAARTLADPSVRVRPLDPDRYEADMAVVKDIYNDAWAENYASVPLTDREFQHSVKQLKPLIRPELLQIVEVHGEPVAFTLWIPDFNQALRVAHGRLTTFGLPTGLLRITRAARRINRTRAITSGIRKDHRNRGLAAAMFTQAQRAAFRLGYTESELSWILEDNHHANRYAKAAGGILFRTHRLYEREAGPFREIPSAEDGSENRSGGDVVPTGTEPGQAQTGQDRAGQDRVGGLGGEA
jgi:GNAT superfamily N-acetyltransferase